MTRKPQKREKSKPATTAHRDKTLLLVFVVLLLLYLLLVTTVRLYPFIDLPNHLAAATIFKHFGEQSNRFPAYYNLEMFPKPNVLHVVFMGAVIFPSVEFAAKIWYALYVLLLPSMLFLLIRRAGGNQWYALLTFLVLFNFNVSWGFAGFTLGLAIFMLLFYFIIEHLKHERLLTGVIVGGLFLLLFFTHGLLTLFAMMVYVVSSLYVARTALVSLLRKIIPILPVGAIYLWWWLAWPGVGLIGNLTYYYRKEYLPSFTTRISEMFFRDGNFVAGGLSGELLGLFFFICISAPLIVWLFRQSLSHGKKTGKRTLIWPFTILFLCALACCLFVPFKIPGIALLYQRFSALLLLSLILLAGVLLPGRLPLAGKIAIVAVCAFHFALWTDYFVTFNHDNRSFTRDFMPRDAMYHDLGGVIYDYQYRGQPIYIHFPNYFTVWREGVATTSLIDYRPGSIRRASARRRLPFYNAWVGKHNNYDGRYRNLDYILVRGEVPAKDSAYYADFSAMRHADDWTIFRKKVESGGQ